MDYYTEDGDIIGFTGFPRATLFALLWTTVTVFWSIFTPPHKTFPARVLLFQPAWLLRGYLGDNTVIQDLILSLGLHSIYSFCTGSWTFVAPGAFRDSIALKLDADALQTYFRLGTMLGVCCILAGIGVVRGQQLSSQEETRSPHLVEQKIDESILPPLLIRSRTTHTRMFPKKHSFSYSYLFVGVPIGIKGSVGGVLSVDSAKPAWFDIRSMDYLDRSSTQYTLGEKLKQYLRSQGVSENDYEFAYLVTAPRFLGYSFNPVSFWYLYDEDTNLKYMALEVNNTFDERRMYLLKAGGGAAALDDFDSEATTNGNGASARTVVFTNSWSKDFHVSPFNSRAGSYSLRAVDPLASLERTGLVQIDNTIVLKSSEHHPKIIARVFSTDAPLEPSKITTFQLSSFIATWWWVGLATLPRIIWEAQKLFFKNKLQVYYRPEVTAKSIGRTYTDDEWDLEELFRTLLGHVVEQSRDPLRLIYEPAHHQLGEKLVWHSPSYKTTTHSNPHHPANPRSRTSNSAANATSSKPDPTLTIKVLTPAFYTRLLHYSTLSSALTSEALCPHEKARTALLYNDNTLIGPTSEKSPESLQIFFRAVDEVNIALQLRHAKTGFFENARWNLLKRLRCSPEKPSYPRPEEEIEAAAAADAAAESKSTLEDIKTKNKENEGGEAHFSELEHFLLLSSSSSSPSPSSPSSSSNSVSLDFPQSRSTYLRIATKQFLASRYTFGISAVIDLLDLLFRAIIILVGMILCEKMEVYDFLRPRAWVDSQQGWRGDLWRVMAVFGVLGNAVHLWRAVKGG
jgi:DUF1365 family protein